MDYDTIAAHFLVPGATTPPAPQLPQTPARRLRDAVEVVATIGWWSREASGAVNALGHDFFDGYVWGRAASLGSDVSPAVAVAAFGVFDPPMLSAVYAHGRGISSRDAVLDARADGAAAGLMAATADVPLDDIRRFGDRLLDALGTLDGAGRPLFGALRDLPLPASEHGRAWRAAELVREHRNDGHIAAFIAAGLRPADVNVLTEVWLGYPVGEYSSSRGCSPEQVRTAAERLQGAGWLDGDLRLTDDGRSTRDGIELATDRTQQGLIDALGDDFDEVATIGESLSAAILRAHAGPADPRKRAAG